MEMSKRSCNKKFGVLIVVLCVYTSGCNTEKSGWAPAESPLFTRWTKNVSPKNVLPEYPRPQMVRDEWMSLNGLWEFSVNNKDEGMPEVFDGNILVPFPIESALSGVGQRIDETQSIWYKHTFKIPKKWRENRILLHFGAVDWESQVYINGESVGIHRGGYDAFTYDITEYCTAQQEQEIVVSVWDPTDRERGQPIGKQTLRPRGIFYTPSSGIWQTVWLEAVPETYIQTVKMIPEVDTNSLLLKVETNEASKASSVVCTAYDKNKQIAQVTGTVHQTITLKIPDAKLWSPQLPHLYDLFITLIDESGNEVDAVKSYFAMRKISVGKDEIGITRLLLNNSFVFQLGPLDQGFWPDGLYTAPTDDALKYDIEMMKKMRFNMVRKHVKVEPSRWYYWCDKLGLMVWQDMPSGKNRTEQEQRQFEYELERMVVSLYNHPSIVMWVPFNEGWGQYDSPRLTDWLCELDPSRLINHASGWNDRGVGDVHDIHSYPNPRSPQPEEKRAAVLGEFGGLGYNMPGHAWNPEGWGYDLLGDLGGLATRYESLFENLLPLIEDPGLSAAVYTQITDIESENNGLMTYDREIIKIDPQTAQLAHQGYFAPKKKGRALIFVDITAFEFENVGDGAIIRYTTDGSEPDNSAQQYSEPIRLTETTTVKAKAFWENGVESRVTAFTIKKVAAKAAVEVEEMRPGLSVAYYEGNWTSVPDFSTLIPSEESVSTKFDLSKSQKETYYGLEFTGYVLAPTTGVYTFYINSDDGSQLLIGEEKVVDNDGVHGMREQYGTVALKRGYHPIRLLYFQGAGGRGLQVSYEGPGIEKTDIPYSAVFRSINR